MAKQDREEAKRRLIRMRVEASVSDAADKFIAQTLITPPGFSPRPSQLPCRRISSLKIYDWMRFVEVWGGLYTYRLDLQPDVSKPSSTTSMRCACFSNDVWGRGTVRQCTRACWRHWSA